MKNNNNIEEQQVQKQEFLFDSINYKILLIGIAVIALGFILMSGGGSKDPNVFNEDIFNFRRIRLAPTTVLIGFGITIYSIFKKSK
ncbi:DUF3098 domain-containing protein [Flavobacterium humidisoli]|jgi:hypothetical protein|uniref:DUF3098 domain-containing protein n=1 Tax=Flavobacterium humidisoli TaxID=2937442 RepID=A0ABY4LX16_9FLAO|nr:DUF3098 domain-containing protein [Flavobacterium humidisoli]UPZ16351.1 DUF3098 domain-containing protein [Flavobacterium humidisoli]